MASTVDNIIQGGGKAYYADSTGTMQYLGILHEDGLEHSFSENINSVKSATSGEGVVAHFTGGTTGTVKLKLREFDKFILSKVFQQLTATSVVNTNGYTGTLKGGSDAGKRLVGRRLIVYPTGVDATGTQFLADETNPCALEVYKAVNISDMAWMNQPDQPTEIELEFEAQFDDTKTNGNKVYFIGAGVDLTPVV